MEKYEVVLTIEDDGPDHRRVRGPDGCFTRLNGIACHKWFGTDVVGTRIRVTVEEIGPTWPAVRMDWRLSLPLYCGNCGRGLPSTERVSHCEGCGKAVQGEVPQSKVADFLKEEG